MHQASATDLFEPARLGEIEIGNRIVMAPLTRSRCGEEGVPGPLQALYYAQRASAGLIIAEATHISPQGRGYAGTPGIWSQAQIEGWSAVTDAVHAAGGRIALQLWHVGRFSSTVLQPDGAAPLAPSAVQAEGQTYAREGMVPVSMPRAMKGEEIAEVVAQYARAAGHALQAGFDGVELHAANNYLLEQFLRDSTNRRTDRYGGSIENRIRLPLEVARAVAEVCGAGRVGIRLSPVTRSVGNTPLDGDVMALYGRLLEQLNSLGLAWLHLIEGATGGSREPPTGVDLDALRSIFHGRCIGNNGYDRTLAITRLAAGRIDAVAFGRAYIANPDLVRRLRENIALAEAPPQSYYGEGGAGYTDWPCAGG